MSKKHFITELTLIGLILFSISSCSSLKEISREQDEFVISVVNKPYLNQKQIAEDIDQFLNGLNSASPFIYNEVDSLEVIRYAKSIKANDSLSFNQFFLEFRKLASMFQMSHLYIGGPYRHLKNEFNEKQQGILPLALEFNNKTYQWDIASSQDSTIIIKKGDRLAKINNMPADSLINTYFDYVTGPKSSRYVYYENGEFGVLLYLAGFKPPYAIEIDRNGELLPFTIQGYNPFTPSASSQPIKTDEINISNYIEYKILDENSGLVVLKSFDIYFDKEIEKKYRSVLEDAVNEFTRNNISKILIDLRGNGGGSSGIANLAIAYFLREPLQFSNNSFLKMSPEWKEFINRHPYFIRMLFNRFYAPGFFKLKYGEIYHKNVVGKIKPVKSPRFNGELFVAIDQLTASAALYLADDLQYHKAAKLIGQPTSNSPTEHTNMIYFRTKHSGISYSLPTIYAIRANGDAYDGSPLKPDILIETSQEDFKKVIDPVVEAFRKL
jgi:hypothetical protein